MSTRETLRVLIAAGITSGLIGAVMFTMLVGGPWWHTLTVALGPLVILLGLIGALRLWGS